MSNQQAVSARIDAFMRLTQILSERRMFVRRAVVEKDGAGVGPWLILKDGAIVDDGPLNDLIVKHTPH
ncbi:MAG: hypothetical protein K2P80_13790 [Beijerinckiaceae bacterium]|nr:hypothetical protein [Beijerinckiaceae bacterium]